MTAKNYIDAILASPDASLFFVEHGEGGDIREVTNKILVLIHPDKCSEPDANDASVKLIQFRDSAMNGLDIGTDDAGSRLWFGDKLVITVIENNIPRVKESVRKFKHIKSVFDKKDSASKYIPKDMKLSDDQLTITFNERAVPIHDKRFNQNHVNWIFSRIFEGLMYLHKVGYAHMGINPKSIFVVPETHGIIFTSFYHSTAFFLDKEVTTISQEFVSWYPRIAFYSPSMMRATDMSLTKRTAYKLLGGANGNGPSLRSDDRTNKEFLEFLIQKLPHASMSKYKAYRKMLRENFEKKFYPLNM